MTFGGLFLCLLSHYIDVSLMLMTVRLRIGAPWVALTTAQWLLHVIPFRVSQEPMKWRDHATTVTEQSIAAAISWLEKLTFKPMTMHRVRCLDALMEAGKDQTVSVYLWLAQITKVASSQTLHTYYLHTAFQLTWVPSQEHPTKAPSLALKNPRGHHPIHPWICN